MMFADDALNLLQGRRKPRLFVPYEDILYYLSVANYTKIVYMKDGAVLSYLSSSTLGVFERGIPKEHPCWRIRKSMLVPSSRVYGWRSQPIDNRKEIMHQTGVETYDWLMCCRRLPDKINQNISLLPQLPNKP